MSISLIKKHIHFIYLLGETSSACQRKALLNSITGEQFRVLSLILFNIIHKKIYMEPNLKKSVKRYRSALSTITDSSTARQTRLKLLKQNPLAAGRLIKAALPALKHFFQNETQQKDGAHPRGGVCRWTNASKQELTPTETSEGLKIWAQSCPGERRLTQTERTQKKITQLNPTKVKSTQTEPATSEKPIQNERRLKNLCTIRFR